MKNFVLPRINFLGCPLDAATVEDTVESIATRIDQNIFTQHVVVNVAKLVNMQDNQALSTSIKSCDIINIDGMGVVYAARLFRHKVPERVTGIDLFLRLLEMSVDRDFPVFLLGAKEDVLNEACAQLENRYPGLNIAGRHHGYFWEKEEEVVKTIQASGARMLFVGISSPKKENFINRWRDQLGVDFVMGVGGSFDVVSGRIKRAPILVQTLGFEWLFRLAQEPRRLYKRYLLTNFRFSIMLLQEFLTCSRRRG